MKLSALALLQCVCCSSALALTDPRQAGKEIFAGTLRCPRCSAVYPIVDSIPRFISPDNYARTFGLQWNRFRETQLDFHSRTTISRDRFLAAIGRPPKTLMGARVLDAGCGAGRFVEVALSLGAEVFAIDYSTAVDACWKNFPADPGLHIFQADLRALPFRPHQFDLVHCLGVLQHTPNMKEVLMALSAQVRQGGALAVDVYEWRWRNYLRPRDWLRPLTRRLPPETLYALVQWATPTLLRGSRALGRVPWIGRYLRALVPVFNYEGYLPLTPSQLLEWAVLDTFDWLSARYNRSQTASTLRSLLIEAGLRHVEVVRETHLVGRGRRSHA